MGFPHGTFQSILSFFSGLTLWRMVASVVVAYGVCKVCVSEAYAEIHVAEADIARADIAEVNISDVDIAEAAPRG